jgi:hypothetical protein
MRDLDELFRELQNSGFRSRRKLGPRDRGYLMGRGLPVILDHAKGFILERLAPAEPHNDGRQTPLQGHPVFVAQHATATCCRGCLEKWHFIRRGQALSKEEIEYLVSVIRRWLVNHEPLLEKKEEPAD